ncbi:hypothetical protein CHS0354_010945 [Potamilus streckersoni]|uniref:Uncharacterized protein n=1 Tax=Potamilus streckersoni TaxID=2493646 RepID=A0AAE0SSW2_9BIVA|nr:hypothetical protein CHS0354_010945 [Potamilus streckersoni]
MCRERTNTSVSRPNCSHLSSIGNDYPYQKETFVVTWSMSKVIDDEKTVANTDRRGSTDLTTFAHGGRGENVKKSRVEHLHTSEKLANIGTLVKDNLLRRRKKIKPLCDPDSKKRSC